MASLAQDNRKTNPPLPQTTSDSACSCLVCAWLKTVSAWHPNGDALEDGESVARKPEEAAVPEV